MQNDENLKGRRVTTYLESEENRERLRQLAFTRGLSMSRLARDLLESEIERLWFEKAVK